jgi:nonsense-mediated mRNA decay protein 3
MGIKDRFCPKCGRPTQGEGVCNQCKSEETVAFSCDQKVWCTQCPSCGALKQGNVWSDTNLERSEISSDLARSGMHIHPDVKNGTISIRIDDMSTNRSRAIISFTGVLYDKPVHTTCETEIVWQKEQCDRCNRISGNYYEGVVQVRAHDRIPSQYEVQMAAGLAHDVEDSLQTGGERLSFISDVNVIRDGLDIIVGSQHIGLLIARRITAELGGRFSTHPKLIGERDGQQLYRITYSVRLPKYQKCDVIRFQKHYGEVIQADSRSLRVFDFSDGKVKVIAGGEVERLVGSSRTAEDAMVAFSAGNTLGVIDPLTFATHECIAWRGHGVRAGQQIRILRDGDHIVVLR